MERFENYMARGGTSESMIDHYFDKLIHLVAPLLTLDNTYFVGRAQEAMMPMLEVCSASRPDGVMDRIKMAYLRV